MEERDRTRRRKGETQLLLVKSPVVIFAHQKLSLFLFDWKGVGFDETRGVETPR